MEAKPLPDPKDLVAVALKKVTSIATLPEVTAKIIATVEDPKSSASQLHKIVAHDPALCTRILKVVNSAFYGLPGQIGSIERAIVLLGLNAVKNIAVAASLGQLFRGAQLCEGYTAKDLWTHCIAVGVTARELAKQSKLPLADEAFLAGMIHDLGMIVALQTGPDKLRQACETARAQQQDFVEIERAMTGGVDHQMLGMALAEAWKFPRPHQLVAGYHHTPMLLSDDNRVLVGLVYVADTLCCAANQGFNLTAVRQKVDPQLLGDLRIDPLVVERVNQNLPTLVQTAAGVLG